MSPFSAGAFAAFLLLLSGSRTHAEDVKGPEIWKHGWGSVGEMLYMHGKNWVLLTPEAEEFTAENYPIVCLSNCYGSKEPPHGMYQEDAAILTARNLRKVNPNVKNVFYWKGDIMSQLERCSNAAPIADQHPEWRLKVDGPGDKGWYNFTNPAVRTFWKNHVLSLAWIMDEDNNTPLFNGFFLDGALMGTGRHIPVDPETQTGMVEGNQAMIRELQTELNYLGYDQILVTNGEDKVQGIPSHALETPASMVDHFAILQFVNRTKGSTGEWLVDPMKELLFDVVRNESNANRTLIIKGWPGPIVKQRDQYPPTIYQPSTPEEMQEAAAFYLNSTLALFLLVAEETMWFSYSWFWNAGDYIPYGKDHTTPDEFYPMYKCPLGEPLGPPQEVEGSDYEFTREYEHASVYVNLNDRNATGVTWTSGDPESCPRKVVSPPTPSLPSVEDDGTNEDSDESMLQNSDDMIDSLLQMAAENIYVSSQNEDDTDSKDQFQDKKYLPNIFVKNPIYGNFFEDTTTHSTGEDLDLDSQQVGMTGESKKKNNNVPDFVKSLKMLAEKANENDNPNVEKALEMLAKKENSNHAPNFVKPLKKLAKTANMNDISNFVKSIEVSAEKEHKDVPFFVKSLKMVAEKGNKNDISNFVESLSTLAEKENDNDISNFLKLLKVSAEKENNNGVPNFVKSLKVSSEKANSIESGNDSGDETVLGDKSNEGTYYFSKLYKKLKVYTGMDVDVRIV